MTRLILILVFCLAGCTGSYTGKDLFGADEFVLDSYKIREGKFSILEMAGICTEELDEEFFEESQHGGVVNLMGMAPVASIPVDGKMRLYDLLFQAKIPMEANLFKSYVLRDGKKIPVDLCKLIKEGDMEQNIAMRGGDKIYIAAPHEASLMVMGDVPQTIFLPLGSMPLKQALAEAGISGEHIQVIRGALSKPKIYALRWEHLIRLPNESLLLMPGDVIHVSH